jgi:hypothetical protein
MLRPYKAEGTKMRKVTFATIATAGLAAATFGLASPASAAPTDTGTARDTINELKAQGYTVIVNKAGNAPLGTPGRTPGRPEPWTISPPPSHRKRSTSTSVARTLDDILIKRET